ncbi:hypothetical protein [Thiomicrorhabdus indica]|uniref:hypothetical protein n=1 Tax=Thiomicrorhabdus indica TaxID=2267253 RepID=UPI00102DDE8E|nr:hypothetical protein [Thiomicrorhabdus indica]
MHQYNSVLKDCGFSEAHLDTFLFLQRLASGLNIIASADLKAADKVMKLIAESFDGQIGPSKSVYRGKLADVTDEMLDEYNIFVVDEINERKAVRRCVELAMSGAQVWASVRSHGVLNVIDKLHFLLMNELIFSPTILTGVCCVKEIPMIDSKTKSVEFLSQSAEKHIPFEARNRFMRSIDIDQNIRLRIGNISSTTVVAEVLALDEYVGHHLLKSERLNALDHMRNKIGFQTMLQHASTKMANGILDPRDVELALGSLMMTEVLKDNTIGMDEISRSA